MHGETREIRKPKAAVDKFTRDLCESIHLKIMDVPHPLSSMYPDEELSSRQDEGH